jgi:flagellar motor switch protein FliN/FliY
LTAPLAITAASDLSTVEATVTPTPAPSPSTGVSPATVVASPPPVDERIEVLLDIDLPLVVRFGHTELPLRHLMKLGPGSVIDLGRSPDEPVELLVSNRVVARGEVVVVSGSYGVRILDVVSQRERVSSMEV